MYRTDKMVEHIKIIPLFVFTLARMNQIDFLRGSNRLCSVCWWIETTLHLLNDNAFASSQTLDSSLDRNDLDPNDYDRTELR